MSNLNDMLNAHLRTVAQINIEEQYNSKLIDYKISQFISNDDDMQTKQSQGVTLVNEYLSSTYHDSKMERIKQLSGLCVETLVKDIFIGVARIIVPELFTSITAQMANRLGLNDKTEAITTIAEIMAVLCRTDAFDIYKADKMSSLVVISRIPLDKDMIKLIEDSQYLPPMVVQPAVLENNYSSGYLTHNDSLILGKGNHHNGDICIDVLNIMNSVKLSLNEQFLAQVEEVPTHDLDTQDKAEQWAKFKAQSQVFYSLMINHGNQFHLTNKVDKRGRIYAQGYHINTQGNSYKKAMIELANKEIVTGVPVI